MRIIQMDKNLWTLCVMSMCDFGCFLLTNQVLIIFAYCLKVQNIFSEKIYVGWLLLSHEGD